MSSPLNPDATDDPGANVQGDLVELMPSVEAVVGSLSKSFHVALVTGSGPSLSTETTSLLHTRLRAVAVLLLVVYGAILVWIVANQDAGLPEIFVLNRNLTFFRLVLLGLILAVLYAQDTYTQTFLRGVEYTLLGALTLFWIYGRYRAVVYDAQAPNLTSLLVTGREAMIGLFMLMIVHGLFIPHHWQGTAQVVLTMALAPTATLVLFQTRHPELAEQVNELLTWRNVSMNVLIVVVGAFLATYGSYVLNA